MPSFQTFVCQKIADYVEDEYQTNIEIGRVDIAFFSSIIVEDVLIEDQQQDTLAYVERLKLGVRFIKPDLSKSSFNTLSLSKPYFNIYRTKEGPFNTDFLFPETSDTSSFAFHFLKLAKLEIADGRFRFHDSRVKDSSLGVNYDHVDVSNLDLTASRISLKPEKTEAFIESLGFYEENGFELQKLAAHFELDKEKMDFKALVIQTENSDINADYSMHFDEIGDMVDFIDKVRLESNFSEALISLPDLAYFVPDFTGIRSQVFLQGKVNGLVSNLSGNDVRLFVDKETFLEGEFHLRGLPDIESTYMFFDLKELKTSASGLRRLPYPPFEDQNQLFVPKNMDNLGDIIFKGEFTGFYNDFVAYGEFKTALGKIGTDLSLKENESGKFAYNGEVRSKQFLIGKLIEFENLSELGLDLQIEGEGLSIDEIKAKAVGNLDYFTLNGYRYDKVALNGEFTNQTFIGEVSLNDKNLAFDFTGLIDASLEDPISRFQFNLYHSRLAQLNLFQQQDSLTQLSLCAEIDILGSELDNFDGMARMTDIRFSDSRLKYDIDSVEFNATGTKGNRKLSLASDLVDGEIQGDYNIKRIPETLLRFFEDYIPANITETGFKTNQNFSYHFVVKDAEPLTKVLIPSLEIDSTVLIEGKLNTTEHQSQLKLQGSSITYAGVRVEDPLLEISSKLKNLKFDFSSTALYTGALPFRHFQIASKLEEGEANTNVAWKALVSESDSADLNIQTKFSDVNSFESNFQNSWFKLNDSIWNITDSNQIAIDTSSVQFSNFRLYNGVQSFSVSGGVSRRSSDTLNMILKNLDLSYLSQVIPEGIVKLGGIANGKASLQDVYQNFSLISDVQFNALAINEVPIGKAKLISTWDPENKALLVKANLGENEGQIFDLTGSVFPLRDENSLDLLLRLEKFPAILFKPYLEGTLSEIEGALSGEVQIKGESAKPILNGEIALVDTRFRIDYLNTLYSLSDNLFIRPDYIGFNHIKLIDENNQQAIATGTILHDNYADLNIDIGLQLKNFLVLNTSKSQNDLYYGKAIVNGDANISGYDGQTNFEINVSTEKGTDLSIPISDGVGVNTSELLTFTNSPKKIEVVEKIDLTGIQLNFDLDIKPEAQVQIIFDEQVGDIMKARGTGKLNLEINTLGDFNIFGQYIVTEGDYLFTLQNIMSKQFEIAEGSNISWDGDPYTAVIDIRAIYELRASLIDIMPEDTTSNLRRRVPVELELQMTNKLFSPDINFDIRLPKSDEIVKRRLESILYVNQNDVNQQEMNQQVFGLLVLNRFLPPTSGYASDAKYNRGTPGVNNGYEFLSNQLSNMLSKMSDKFDIGVNYRPGDEVTDDELDLSLSTEVFNDRLVLDGNVGYVSQNTTTEEQDGTSFIGEFSAEYKLSLDGRFRVRGFNRSTTNSLTQYLSPYTQGIGFFYREEFNTFNELWRRYFHAEKDKDDQAN